MFRGTAGRQTIDLRVFLDGLVAAFANSARARGITFEALSNTDELNADPSLLRRLLVSLTDHAIRRAPDGTNVTLMISPRPGFVELRIVDEGPRLAPEVRPQADLAPVNGVGVQEGAWGLTYCRWLTETQGGRFWMADAANGAVVCCALPTVDAQGPQGFARAKSGTQLRACYGAHAAQPRTILVVDDEPLVRAFLSRALRDKGFGVIEADCAERAIERLMTRAQPLALLLSDVGLPGASGAVLVRQARLLNPTLPTLLMSATDKLSLVRDGVIREGTDLLQKPFSIADLLTRLDELLPRPARAR